MSDAKRKRVPIEFSATAYNHLQRLQRETDATSNVEVIRDALRVYDYILGQMREGWELRLVRDKEAKALVLLNFERAKDK